MLVIIYVVPAYTIVSASHGLYEWYAIVSASQGLYEWYDIVSISHGLYEWYAIECYPWFI